MGKWSIEKSAELYGITDWGGDYFVINKEGNLCVRVDDRQIDLKKMLDELRERGIETPILIRILDIIESRLQVINESFQRAIREFGYKGRYQGVYPIKVNQQRHVVEKLLKAGRPYNIGLEAGSKPELLASVALCDDPDALIVCNGFKDVEFIETALLSLRLRENVIIVLDRPHELDLVLDVSERLGIRPRLGVRCKLSSRGTGRWGASSGDNAKFGLTSKEILEVVEKLEEKGLLDCLVLLHFHIGSQIAEIISFKRALWEAGRLFIELKRIGVPLDYLDVGGGLGVSYTGYRVRSSSSLNYTTQEYANDVVYWIGELCDEAGLPHPTLVSESGRALVAHHSILIFDVLGATVREQDLADISIPDDAHQVIRQLEDVHDYIRPDNCLEAYHDIQHLRDEFLVLFRHGIIGLRTRALAEHLYWSSCSKILAASKSLDILPSELAALQQQLADTYYCNFSLFQSIPDSWSMDQVFPIIPIHRLEEEPTRRTILADLTCDSDGTIDAFIGEQAIRETLCLHQLTDKEYFLAAMMVGAYQEILGDLHNLFGDTNTVAVSLVGPSEYMVEDVVEGESVADVLEYVQYSSDDLTSRMRRKIEDAIRSGRLDIKQSRGLLRAYTDGLQGYTYLEREEEHHTDPPTEERSF